MTGITGRDLADSLNGNMIGSSSHIGSFSQSLVGALQNPCCEVNHVPNTAFELTQ